MRHLRILLISLIGSLPFASVAAAMELVMVEQHGCVYCARWNAEIAPIYPKTSEGRAAPLRRIELRTVPADLSLHSTPIYTPTFILVKDGIELSRLEGYPGEDFFWPMLSKMLKKSTYYMEDGS
jgi:hypothetical protein